MPRQTICVHIGQAGIQLGNAIWELIGIEHGIKTNGSLAKQYAKSGGEKSACSFFSLDSHKMKYAPRCLFIDTESMVIDEIRTGCYKNFFPDKALISGIEDASNLFPRGFKVAGQQVLTPSVDGIRLLSEASDCLNGLIIFKSCGGGTGSGSTVLFLNEIAEEFSKINISELAVIPAPFISNSIVESYNAVLTLFQTMKHISLSFNIDNEALYEITKNNLYIERPSYFNVNRIIAQIVSSITASLRFQSVLSTDFNLFQTNLVPYPQLKYPIISYAPIISSSSKATEPDNLYALTEEVFQRKNFTIKCYPEYGEYMACAVLYRGKNCGVRDATQAVAKLRINSPLKFVDWSPTGFKIGINHQPPTYVQYSCLGKIKRSVCLIANSTCISQVLDYILQKFDLLYRRKAYVHWFTGEGLEEAELVEARQEVLKLLLNYLQTDRIPQS